MEKILVLGPKYSYSHNLANEYYDESSIVCVPSIGEVFREVSEHENYKGIVPIENMLNGSVRESFLHLKKYSVSILRAFDYKIENILASNSEAYTKIASHSQPLAQCGDFVSTLKNIELIETSSTSKAMELASSDSTIAAIGNEKAAKHYGVAVIKTDISNKDTNITRFIEITKNKPEDFDSGEKTSMMIRPLEDRAGILFEILSIFQIKNINLTKIESIPTGVKMNDYVFYIDIEGNLKEKRVTDALDFLKTFVEVDVFGSYTVESK
jgi:prephenate dehydratase